MEDKGVPIHDDLTKFCSSCKTLVDVINYHRSINSHDGLSYICKDCASASATKRYAENKIQCSAEGRCREYGCKLPHLEHHKKCLRHFYSRQKVDLPWDDLKMLAESQGYICPLTGDSLVPGKNMSLDHIKPKSCHPELFNDINNLQWVTNWANVAKWHLSEEEFYSNCEKAYKNKNKKSST
jgi:hypothetical protein